MILEKSKTIKPPKGQVEISIKESGGGIEVRRIDDGRTLVASERFNKEMYSKEMYTINKKIIKPCEKCNNSRMYAFGNLYEDEYDLIRCGCRNKLQFIKKYVDFDGSEITEEERNFLLDKLVCPECKKSNEFIIIPKCGEVEYKCKECGESIVVNCEEYETLKEKCECGHEVFVLEVEREGNIDLYDSYCKKCHERSEDSYVYFDGSKIVEITEDKRSILLLEDKIKKKNRLIHRLEVKLSKKNRLIKKLRNKLNNPDDPDGSGGSRGWEEDWDREKQITFNTFNNYEEEEKELELKRKKEREKQRDRGMEMER